MKTGLWNVSKHSYSSLLALGCQKYNFLHVKEEEIMLGKMRLLQRQRFEQSPGFLGFGASYLNAQCVSARDGKAAQVLQDT